MRNRSLQQPLAWTEKGAFVRRPRYRLAWLAGFVALCLLVIELSAVGYLAPVQEVVLRGLAPLQSWLAGLAGSLNSMASFVGDLWTLRQRNAELESQINNLLIENVQLKEVEVENANLRRLLQFAEAHPFLTFRGAEVVARVIGRDPINLSNYLIIDLGQEHGIREGMPVVTERGLVGRITQVHRTSSRVMLLSDPASAVSALLQSSRLTGIIQGQAGGGLIMEYIPQDAAVVPGEIVITSGLGGRFPRGLVIGQVISVYRRDYEMFQRAVVRPSADFDRIEHVLVITNFVPLTGLDEEGGP
ncbi:MAG: rod shape-determining protein MreC [Anaerolineae bacterium]|nr:rod shape-determining protein MreC [Anaerolineae bacterium]MDW8099344.1 rod shape-determining protein MreC [Anaerolineae bacterium]